MKFSDIFKKGYGAPAPTDIIDGGLAIDIQGKKGYSKGSDGTIFPIGHTDAEISALVEASLSLPPVGGIIMYAGPIASIPANWAICNGSNGTPNLVDKFIYGTASAYSGATGGYADSVVVAHNHTTVAHNHTGATADAGGHSHTYTRPNALSIVGAGYEAGYVGPQPNTATSSVGHHKHTVSIDNKTVAVNSNGVSGTGRNIPPYVKLMYIMRKS